MAASCQISFAGVRLGVCPMTAAASLDNLVDLDRGLVSREIFVSKDIYNLELETLFTRA
jgi:hypothetical protein